MFRKIKNISKVGNTKLIWIVIGVAIAAAVAVSIYFTIRYGNLAHRPVWGQMTLPRIGRC